MKDLGGQTVLVTGGAGRLGEAFVRAIANHGAHPVILDSNAEGAREVCDRLCAELGAGAVSNVPTDITSRESLDQAIEATVARHGAVHALINNAYPRNANYGRPFFNVTYEDGTQTSNRRVSIEQLDQSFGDSIQDLARTAIEDQDNEIARRSGQRRPGPGGY